jgi:hypothetical protein
MHIYVQMLWSGALQNPVPWAAALPVPPSGPSKEAAAHLCYVLLFFDRLPYTCSSNPRRCVPYTCSSNPRRCGLRTALIQNLTVRCPVVNRDGVAPLLLCDLVALHFFRWGSGVGKNFLHPAYKPLCLHFLTYFKIGSILLQQNR